MPLSRSNVQAGVDPVLTQFMNDYENLEFIGDKIFPIINVGNETGTYYTFTAKDKFRSPPMRRAPGTPYFRMDLNPASSTYTCEEDGAEIPVDKRLQATAVDPFDPYRYATETVKDTVLLKRETNIITAVTNATTFASYTEALTGSDRWDDVNSEPVQKIDTRKITIRDNCGRPPNTMIIPWEVYLKLREHPSLLDKVPDDQPQIIAVDMMKKFFDIERFFVSMATYNVAEEGQTVDLDPVMGKSVFIGWINPSPAPNKPSVGYLIQKEGFIAETYYEDQTRSDVVRARVNEVPKIVATDCGYLITTVIS